MTKGLRDCFAAERAIVRHRSPLFCALSSSQLTTERVDE
jgi:hypothetical protein